MPLRRRLGRPIHTMSSFVARNWQRPTVELDPPALLSGDDLIGLGIPRGPVYARLLKAVRAAQLDGLVASRVDALAMAQQLNNAAAMILRSS